MEQRFKYLSSTPFTRANLKNAGDVLSKREYSDRLSWGFVDIHNTGGLVSGTFVERFETEEEITHPFGHVTVYKRIRFNQIRFRLGTITPQLEILDAPRSVAPLLTELASCFDSPVAFSPVRLDIKAFISKLKRRAASLALLSASFEDITLGSDVFARVSVMGSGEIEPYLKTAALGGEPIFERVCLSGTFNAETFKVEICSDARIQILVGRGASFAKLLRSLVVESLQINPFGSAAAYPTS